MAVQQNTEIKASDIQALAGSLTGGGVTQGALITASSINDTIYAINTRLAQMCNARGVSASAEETSESLLNKVDANWQAYTPSWHTILSSIKTITSSGVASLPGARANVPTRASFSGTIYTTQGTYNINSRLNVESNNARYTGNGTDNHCNGTFGFTLSFSNDGVSVSGYATGSHSDYIEDACVGYYVCHAQSYTSTSISLAKVEQYY